jgi:hypothetical protein
MDAFLYQYVYQMESVAVKAIRSYDKNHLIFGPAALGGIDGAGVRPQVLKALADAGVNVFAISYDPLSPQNLSTVSAAYDLTGKPAILWYGISANRDSYFHDKPRNGHAADYPSQEARGQPMPPTRRPSITPRTQRVNIVFWASICGRSPIPG